AKPGPRFDHGKDQPGQVQNARRTSLSKAKHTQSQMETGTSRRIKPGAKSRIAVPPRSQRRFYGHGIPGVELEKLAGKLIVVEGADGSGRSTQIAQLDRKSTTP